MSLYWHYTDVQSAFSILKNRVLWATAVTHMNDPNEVHALKKRLTHEHKLLTDEITHKGIDAPQHIKQMLDRLTKTLGMHVLNWHGLLQAEKIFSVSFSGDRDSLPMWDRYGKSKGVALGVDLSEIESYNQLVRSKQVRYEDRPLSQSTQGDYVNYLKPYLDLGLFLINEGDRWPNGRPYDVSDFDDAVHRRILEDAASVKYNEFMYEQEIRSTLNLHFIDQYAPTDVPDVKYRVANDMVTPYVEFKLSPHKENETVLLPTAVKKIMIGPRASKELLMASLHGFLSSIGHAGAIQLEVSQCEVV